eukprot:757427-Hanusia_phi.AAC.2
MLLAYGRVLLTRRGTVESNQSDHHRRGPGPAAASGIPARPGQSARGPRPGGRCDRGRGPPAGLRPDVAGMIGAARGAADRTVRYHRDGPPPGSAAAVIGRYVLSRLRLYFRVYRDKLYHTAGAGLRAAVTAALSGRENAGSGLNVDWRPDTDMPGAVPPCTVPPCTVGSAVLGLQCHCGFLCQSCRATLYGLRHLLTIDENRACSRLFGKLRSSSRAFMRVKTLILLYSRSFNLRQPTSVRCVAMNRLPATDQVVALQDYASQYEQARSDYLKAAQAVKMATGPYEAARDAYVAAGVFLWHHLSLLTIMQPLHTPSLCTPKKVD